MVILAKYKEDTMWATRVEDECDVEVRTYQSASQKEPYFVENLGGEPAKYFAKGILFIRTKIKTSPRWKKLKGSSLYGV